jgi:hypothetical protein
MFFTVSQKHQENFSHFYQLGTFCISTDAGWSTYQNKQYTCLYKGYVETGKLELLLDQIVDQTEPTLMGNFCVFVVDTNTNTLSVKTDRYRSFPIYYNNKEITNLNKLSNTIWADDIITVNDQLNIAYTKFNVIGNINTDLLFENEVVDAIDQILTTRTQNFIKNNDLPVRVHLSGGVDSLLVYSYLQKYANNYEMIKCEHMDYDPFWLRNSYTIQSNYWGYGQIHHWNDPCILTSGAPGDEFMLRSPTTGDLYAQFHGESVEQLLDTKQWESCLHHDYFCVPKNYKIFQEQLIDITWNTPEKLMYNLCNIIVNDWQHWHLGNTLTWTPLRDLEIFKLLLRLPVESALGQLMNSNISCRLIERNNMGLTKLISDKKNTGNTKKNLVDFLFRT